MTTSRIVAVVLVATIILGRIWLAVEAWRTRERPPAPVPEPPAEEPPEVRETARVGPAEESGGKP